jgi:histidinol dehydrogenase
MMMTEIGSLENHRSREEGLLVYPVYSRRAQGLSLGVNLFPDEKRCSFDCPYCEVFPFKTTSQFSLEAMEVQLRRELAQAQEREIPVKDICFSGSGEPSASPYFIPALEKAFQIRDSAAPEAALVMITNGAGLFSDSLFRVLRDAAIKGLNMWLKLDAGTPEWYSVMNRSQTPYLSLVNKIKAFTACAPVTIQTMRCKVRNRPPSEKECEAWETLILELAALNPPLGGLQRVQIYGKARPSPEDPLTEALPRSCLEAQGLSLKNALERGGLHTEVQVFP